jgi:hypothetical protein
LRPHGWQIERRDLVGANTRLFWILSGFFFLLAIVYSVWSFIFDAQNLATTLIAFYIGRTRSAQGGELPEDRNDANIDDGDAEQGFFSPWSWWPVLLGGSLALVFLGLAVGFWVSLLGIPLVLIALTGWVYEYYRGYFAK